MQQEKLLFQTQRQLLHMTKMLRNFAPSNRNRPFKLKHEQLFVQSSREACEGVVASDDTMARNENVDAIGSYGLRYCPYAFGVADSAGYLHIVPCFAIGDVEQGLPHLELKCGADGMERNGERVASVSKIVIELALCLFKD